MIGVAVNEDRAINAADFGYLIALFIALYIIRGLVILTAYPVLRSVSATQTSPFVGRAEPFAAPLSSSSCWAKWHLLPSIGHSWE